MKKIITLAVLVLLALQAMSQPVIYKSKINLDTLDAWRNSYIHIKDTIEFPDGTLQWTGFKWSDINSAINDSLARIDDTLADHLDTLQVHRVEINLLKDSLDGGFFTITDTTKSTVTNSGSDYSLGMSEGKVTRDTLIDLEDSIYVWIHDTAGAQISDSLDVIRNVLDNKVENLVMDDSTTSKGIDTVYQFNLDTNTYHLKMDTATMIDWTGGSQGDRYIFMLYQDYVGGRELYFMPGKWQAEHGILNISTGSNDTNVVSGYHTGNKVILSIIQNVEGL